MRENERQTTRSGRIAIIGRPNAGKSTLLNRLLGKRLSIVTHKAQTTRHCLLGVLHLPAGRLAFLDTPGIHRGGKRALNRYMNRSARGALEAADAVIAVFDTTQLNDDDRQLIKLLEDYDGPVLAVLNKVDKTKDKRHLLDSIGELASRYAFDEIVPVSARTGDNVDKLPDLLLQWMPQVSDIDERDDEATTPDAFIAAEMVREQVLLLTHEEVPYRSAVTIESFERGKSGMWRIGAVIWVERAGQKAVVIGKGGIMLKRIGSRARHEMQRFFDCKIHLELWVRVKPDWSNDRASMRQLGYADPDCT